MDWQRSAPCEAGGSAGSTAAPLPEPPTSPQSAMTEAGCPRGPRARRLPQPGLWRAGAQTLPPGSALPHVPQSSSQSFPSPRDRNSYTGYRGLEAAALPSFLPRGRFICRVCNATVLHADSCGVILLCSVAGIFLSRVAVFVLLEASMLSLLHARLLLRCLSTPVRLTRDTGVRARVRACAPG